MYMEMQILFAYHNAIQVDCDWKHLPYYTLHDNRNSKAATIVDKCLAMRITIIHDPITDVTLSYISTL